VGRYLPTPGPVHQHTYDKCNCADLPFVDIYTPNLSIAYELLICPDIPQSPNLHPAFQLLKIKNSLIPPTETHQAGTFYLVVLKQKDLNLFSYHFNNTQ
jgi:hypothetical protein